MGHVDEDAARVEPADELPTLLGQAVASSPIVGAAADAVRAHPERPEEYDPGLGKPIQLIEIVFDDIGALHSEKQGDPSRALGRADVSRPSGLDQIVRVA